MYIRNFQSQISAQAITLFTQQLIQYFLFFTFHDFNDVICLKIKRNRLKLSFELNIFAFNYRNVDRIVIYSYCNNNYEEEYESRT